MTACQAETAMASISRDDWRSSGGNDSASSRAKVSAAPPGVDVAEVLDQVLQAGLALAFAGCEARAAFVPMPETDAKTARAPYLRIERLPEASHWVTHEEPERLNRLIREFIGA